jgi:Glycosyltransferase family 87
MKSGKLKLMSGLYLSGLLTIYVLFLWHARDLIWKGYPDFTIYYTAGTIVRGGMGHKLFDDVTQFNVQKTFAPDVATRLAALPFNHPPFEALLFVPFSYLSYRVAFLFWALANLALLAVCKTLLQFYVPLLLKWPSPVWTLAAFVFFPIFFALLQGQDSILLLFFYVLTFISLKNERFLSAGAWLGCGLFKFHLVLPFLFLLLLQERNIQRRKKILAGFLSVGTVLGVVSIAVVGVQQMISYPRYVLALEATMAKGAIMPSDMPNLRGVLFLVTSNMRHFDSLVVVLSAVLFLFAARKMQSLGDDIFDLKFSLAVLTTMLVSYHGLGYDLCVLALPVLLLAEGLQTGIGSANWARAAIIAGLAALLFPPLSLVLLMRYNRLALLGWTVLLCFVGVCGELGSRTRGNLESLKRPA